MKHSPDGNAPIACGHTSAYHEVKLALPNVE
jgi:hypothetical protein